MKRVLSILLCLMLCIPAAAAFAEESSAVAQGFGGEVRVTVSIQNGKIISVTATGENETPGVGSRAIEQLPKMILAAQSADIDALSGCTVSSNAVLKAAKEAIAAASGTETAAAQVVMTPGTYTGRGVGYGIIGQLALDVTVDETSIVSITVNDPATGTGTFLRSIILDVFSEYKKAHALQGWNAFVKNNLLTRLYGFEFMMAPYAVAHMKLAMTLKDTGYVFEPNHRLQVYLANALENGDNLSSFGDSVDPLVKESNYAALVRNSRINVILGNPPYRTDSINKGDWIMRLMEDYKKEPGQDTRLQERNPKVVNDDYVKFIRFAQEIIAKEDNAIIGYVTPHSFTENLTFRGMRWKLLHSFDYIYIFDLHGNVMSREDTGYLTDETGSKVTGVRAIGSDGTEYTINAGAVIIATGGFAANKNMMERYVTEPTGVATSWPIFGYTINDGAMIEAAIDDLNAGVYNIDMVPVSHYNSIASIMKDYPVTIISDKLDSRWNYPRTKSLNDVPMSFAIEPDGLWISAQGKRTVNEAAFHVSWKLGANYWSLWGQDTIDTFRENGFPTVTSTRAFGQGGFDANTPIPEMDEILSKCIDMGTLYKASSVEELAGMIGVDTETLVAVIADYNAACESGVDAMGKDAQYLHPITGENLYAFKCINYTYGTDGGLDVDLDLNVLRTDGSKIEGLYATGYDCSGVLYNSNKSYVDYGGSALGWAFTSGRLAGENAVRYIAE